MWIKCQANNLGGGGWENAGRTVAEETNKAKEIM